MEHDHQAVASLVPERTPQVARWRRRDFVKGLTALAGSAALLGYHPRLAIAEPPPETTRLRLIDDRTTCIAPAFLAKGLLKSEGFTDVRYLIAQGTDWWFLDELKKELKA